MSYQKIISSLIESLGAMKLDKSINTVYGTDIDTIIKMLKDYRGIKNKELINKPVLEWAKYKRSNGNEFLKLIYYSTYADGYVELGRFNMSKCETPNNEWTLDEILNELS